MSKKKKASSLLGQTLTVGIEWLDDHGQGVGSVDDRTVAVMGALPGDTVRTRVTWASPVSPWTRGSLLTVVTRSPSRVKNECAHAPHCVGCPLRELALPAQLAAKRARVQRAFSDEKIAFEVPAVIAAPTHEAWRSRSKYVVERRGDDVILGAYAPNSHDVFPSHLCRVVHPAINSAVAVLPSLLRALPALPRFILCRTNGEHVLGTFVVATEGGALLQQTARAWMAQCPQLLGVTAHLQPGTGDAILSPAPDATTLLCGAATLTQSLAGIPASVATEAFTQLHPAAAEHMLTRAAELLAPLAGRKVLDAYCGVGAFAFALRGAASVTGVDDNAPAIAAARSAAEQAGLRHLRFECADTTAWLRTHLPTQRFDAVVVDPPRKGLTDDARAALLAARPATLLYVACEPRSLARDLKPFLAGGYRLTALQPLDLFPHTPEVETLALIQNG